MRIFTEHPEAVGESYGTHARHAASFGFAMVLAGLACLVHAVLPFLFVTTGSRVVCDLQARMGPRSARAAGGAPQATPSHVASLPAE
ncbi:DUF6356 family protein [Algihabitans albus]|uniref:DUF6356 family protein n=1 Tax=Algihabitans albus TaxID=2164067 RepID=UPI001ABC5691|nr:DUF6356 family protein [Algihabitans albus]